MANRYNNKIILGNETLIDLTNDTVAASYLRSGYTAHGADGSPITGTAALVYDASTEELILPGWAVSLSG